MEQQRKRPRPASGARGKTNGRSAKKAKPGKRRAPVQRVKNRRFWKEFIIMLAVAAAVLLSLVIFFRVKTVQVAGCNYYSAERVIEASGIQKGDNLLSLSKQKIASSIMQELPYIKQVQITRRLPNQVQLDIVEHDVSYTVQDTEEQYWLITSDGRVLDQVDKKQALTHLLVEGFALKDPKPAGEVVLENGSEVQKQAALTLLRLLENSQIADKVTSVEVPASYEICFWYGKQYKVLLGSTEDMEYKIRYLTEVIRHLDSYTTGEIDLTFSSERKAIFRAFSSD